MIKSIRSSAITKHNCNDATTITATTTTITGVGYYPYRGKNSRGASRQ